jgi:hypothetical protein
MARFRRKKRRRQSNKMRGETPHASLAAMAPVIEQKGIFDLIHQQVVIPQKTINYRPTDKLVLVILSMLAGNQTISDINWTLRVDRPLLWAFGYASCPDQSTLQDTLNAATEANVEQLGDVAAGLFAQHNLFAKPFASKRESQSLTIDFDLSAQPSSKRAQKAAKGYFAKRKNSYGRQLARISVAETGEVVADQLYAGNMLSCMAFKEMVVTMEHRLALSEKPTRRCIRLRLDGGFGTDENINFALSRGYHLLAKIYSGNRARKLAASVENWQPAPTTIQKKNGEPETREVAWVKNPHRYCRKTRQIAIRTPNAKSKSGYSYRVIVTTDLSRSLAEILSDYDGRCGIPESAFCQDNQGLAARKRRKQSFCAQQMLMYLTQIAHNLCLWLKQWTIDAISFARQCDDWVSEIKQKLSIEIEETFGLFDQSIEMLRARGIKRLTHQLFSLSGQISIKKGRITRIVLKDGYPLMNRIVVAFSALLADNSVQVIVGQT